MNMKYATWWILNLIIKAFCVSSPLNTGHACKSTCICIYMIWDIIFTLHACARGKVIGCVVVVVVVVVSTKIAISQDVGI